MRSRTTREVQRFTRERTKQPATCTNIKARRAQSHDHERSRELRIDAGSALGELLLELALLLCLAHALAVVRHTLLIVARVSQRENVRAIRNPLDGALLALQTSAVSASEGEVRVHRLRSVDKVLRIRFAQRVIVTVDEENWRRYRFHHLNPVANSKQEQVSEVSDCEERAEWMNGQHSKRHCITLKYKLRARCCEAEPAGDSPVVGSPSVDPVRQRFRRVGHRLRERLEIGRVKIRAQSPRQEFAQRKVQRQEARGCLRHSRLHDAVATTTRCKTELSRASSYALQKFGRLRVAPEQISARS